MRHPKLRNLHDLLINIDENYLLINSKDHNYSVFVERNNKLYGILGESSETLFPYRSRTVRIALSYIENSNVYVFEKRGSHYINEIFVIRFNKGRPCSIEVYKTKLDKEIKNLRFHLADPEKELISLYDKYVRIMLEKIKGDIHLNLISIAEDYLVEFIERPIEMLNKLIICLETPRQRITFLTKILNMAYELWLIRFLLKEIAYSFTTNRERTLRRNYILKFEGPSGNKYRIYWSTIPDFLRESILEENQRHKIPDIIVVDDKTGEVKLIIEAKLGLHYEKQISRIVDQIKGYKNLYKPQVTILSSITVLPEELKSRLTQVGTKVVEKIHPGSENLRKLKDLIYEALTENMLLQWLIA